MQQTDATGDHLDDDALVSRVAQGDSEAFRVLIGRHAPMLHRIAYRIVNDAAEAEDIVQESMLRLWDRAPQWQAGKQAAGAWMKRVATNLAIDRVRRNQRLSDDEVPEKADQSPLADAMIEASEQQQAAQALIAALPERQRAAIVLTYYEEMSNADAADALDMKIKAFESLLFRARAALKKAFEAQRGEA